LESKIEFLEEFKEIEPYRNEEFLKAMDRLRNNKELQGNLRKAAFPKLPGFLHKTFETIIGLYVKYKLRNVNTPYEFQATIIKIVIGKIINKTIDEISFSGMDNLEKDKKYLFLSNHRDIVLDPALTNYMMTKNGMPTFEIAFGDNLLVNQLVTDLIRINKSFIVKRNHETPRKQIEATIILSKYIWYTLHTYDSVWIAQREGRAKDGNDLTNPAILKMFFLSQRKGGLPFNEFINELKIVPIALSYEFDPCDRLKARELERRDKQEVYVKRKGEDFISMVKGITDFKGNVHIAVGAPLSGDYKDSKEVAVDIDKFIHQNYKLWPSNYVAYDSIHKTEKYSDKYDSAYKAKFLKRFERLPENILKYALKAYARPVENAESYDNN
jgi:hypothetical protein